jgi:predicted RNA-binding protein with PUA-like domain
MTNYWLVKSELDTYSIDDLKRDKKTFWSGVRNYQARNFLRSMKLGDQVLYYHSVTPPIGIVGLAKVVTTAYPDPTQFDPQSEYYEPKATKDAPRWFCPDLAYVKKFNEILSLDFLREQRALTSMVLLKKGSRLSVQPVTEREFNCIMTLAGA